MQFYSTRNKKTRADLRTAALKGLADDGGLFMPMKIPRFEASFFKNISELSFTEIAFEITTKFFDQDIPPPNLQKIIREAFNFPVKLKKLDQGFSVLELFHGPTLAFKDFAARFMARMMVHFLNKKRLTILVATSGDTGSAVAQGFLNIPNIQVIILYPSQKISKIQEQQLTTMGRNITALEIKGTFDDCQKMVKQAFLDPELNRVLTLASANSINILRLIPQIFYYFWAYAQLKNKNKPVIFSVPSGNFGNLTAGLIAKRMGLPVAKFIASTNINDIVPKYLQSGIFKAKKSRQTISNAMDIGNPSNFERILDLYRGDWKAIQEDIVGFRFTDTQTKSALQEIHQNYGYICDPHTAIAYLGLKKYRKNLLQPNLGIFLSSAHPAKFTEVVEEVLKTKVPMPVRLKKYLHKTKRSIVLANHYEDLKRFLIFRNSFSKK